jgi:hypothetical protein
MHKAFYVLVTIVILPLIFFTLLDAREVRKITEQEIPLSGDELLQTLPLGGSMKSIPSPPRLLQIGTVIDSTTMDFQCNSNIHQRIATVGDSALHVTAMISYDPDVGFATRGMKYVYYYDGVFTNFNYVEGTGIGDERGGFGSVISYDVPDLGLGNIAMITSHTNLDARAFGAHWYYFQDAFQGVGAFTPTEGPIGNEADRCDYPLWISMYITNDLTGDIAMTGRTNVGGCVGPFEDIWVAHKTYGSPSWDPPISLVVYEDWWNGPAIPTLAGADNGYFAIAVHEFQTNVYFWDSTDGGATWSARQNITGYSMDPQFALPDSSSTEYRPTQNHALAMSPGGTPHIIWTAYQARGLESDSLWTPGSGLWQYRTKLEHWDPVNGINEVYRHTTGIADTVQGTAFAFNVGHPSIGFGPTDSIVYAIYEGFVDADVDPTTGLGFGDIYVSLSTDGGATWQDRVNITNSMGSDDLYPAIARVNPQGVVQELPGFSVGNADGVNDFVMIYQNDDVGGTFMRGDELDPNFDMLYVAPVDFETIEVPGTGIGDGLDAGGGIPKAFALGQNYPNPFNPSTTIAFDLPVMGSNQSVNLTIYDLRGRCVRILIDSELEPGNHKIHWNGRDDRGQSVASGIYLYRLKAGDETFTRKMTVLK